MEIKDNFMKGEDENLIRDILNAESKKQSLPYHVGGTIDKANSAINVSPPIITTTDKIVGPFLGGLTVGDHLSPPVGMGPSIFGPVVPAAGASPVTIVDENIRIQQLQSAIDKLMSHVSDLEEENKQFKDRTIQLEKRILQMSDDLEIALTQFNTELEQIREERTVAEGKRISAEQEVKEKAAKYRQIEMESRQQSKEFLDKIFRDPLKDDSYMAMQQALLARRHDEMVKSAQRKLEGGLEKFIVDNLEAQKMVRMKSLERMKFFKSIEDSKTDHNDYPEHVV